MRIRLLQWPIPTTAVTQRNAVIKEVLINQKSFAQFRSKISL